MFNKKYSIGSAVIEIRRYSGSQTDRDPVTLFEGLQNFRKKRDITEFHSALAECEPEKCTIIKCTMGPMEKDEQLLLKVKSRIFTETLVKVSIVWQEWRGQ